MKVIQEEGAAPILSGNMTTVNIGISDNAEDQLMILNVLSNSLYTDKVSAVLREYGCNAFDANVEAGRGEKPIEVRLPNRLDATVAIRDFGLGMTEEQILHTFCKLGRSTKRSSNAFTGMLGIGSKAGFAYGDQFTVTTYAEGMKTIYGCSRLQGVPKLSKMHSEPTDAPEGVEVKVPVRQADIPEFITKAERVFRYFKVRPIFHGAKIDFGKDAPKFTGTNWRYIGNGKSVCIMGNVGYDLSEDSLGTSTDVSYGGKIWTLIKAGIELDFNIGDLEIAANREGLQYKDHTKKEVLAICKVVVKEISKVFTDALANAKTLWDATKVYGELFENRGANQVWSDYNINTIISNNVTWQGHTLNRGRFEIANRENETAVHLTMYQRQPSYAQKKWRRQDRYIDPTHPHNTLLVINDLPTKANSPTRMQGTFEDTSYAWVQNIFVMAFDNKKVQDTYWKNRGLDGAPTVNLSALPVSTTNISAAGGALSPSAHRAKHQASAFILDESGTKLPYGAARSMSWTKTSVNINKDSGPYVVVDNFFVSDPSNLKRNLGYGYDGAQLLSHVHQLRKAGLLKGVKVYAFKKGRVDKLSANWKPLQAYLKEEVAALLKAKGVAQEMADYFAASEITERWDEGCRAEYPKGSLFREYLDNVYDMLNPKANKELFVLINSTNVAAWMERPTMVTASVDLKAKEKRVLAQYPVLSLMPVYKSSCCSKPERGIIADYVTLIESK